MKLVDRHLSAEFLRYTAAAEAAFVTLFLVITFFEKLRFFLKNHATVGDVQWLVKPALRHRIAGNYASQANNLTSDQLIDMLLQAVPADRKYERPAA